MIFRFTLTTFSGAIIENIIAHPLDRLQRFKRTEEGLHKSITVPCCKIKRVK